MVIEGFEPPPVIMAPHNPPYYDDQLTAFGFEKAKDLIVYYADIREGYQIPQRYLTLTDRVQERYGVSVRSLEMARLEEEVLALLEVFNASVAHNWGYYPVTEAEGRVIAHNLKPIIDAEAVLIAEGPDGKAIGCSLPIPDVNVLLRGLNGRLLPFGWLKLLTGLPRLRQYRLWALGMIPEYQGKGVDALLWQTFPLPANPLFQEKKGYGKGCPWACPHSGKVEYRTEDYPETMKLCDSSLVICSEPHPIFPQKMELMKLYVEAIHKVFDNLDQVIE